MIELNAVSKTFREHRVLSRIDLAVRAGEMVALIGPSGAGKSTLMRHVAGLVASDRDPGCFVRIAGNEIQRDGRISRSVRRHRRRIGFVFQQFNLVGRMSLLGNVIMGALGRMPLHRRLSGCFTTAEKREAMRALDFVGMAGYAAQRASTLSGGQQQRGAIARAVMQRAAVLLADEPIASLDPESARLVMEGLRRMNEEEGVTVLVSLHQIEYAKRFCHRAVAMKDGAIVVDAPAATLSADQMERIYGTKPEAWERACTRPSGGVRQAAAAIDVEARAGA
jgi:phosphonate transport system ATP-binding protein